jgi:hypothetical protein
MWCAAFAHHILFPKQKHILQTIIKQPWAKNKFKQVQTLIKPTGNGNMTKP